MDLMEPLNIIKITLGIITAVVALVVSYIQLKRNPTFLLNRLFAGFLIFIGLGFFAYIYYHFIFDDPELVITINILSNIFYNIGFGCLAITPIIIKYSEKDDRVKYASILVFGLCFISFIGFFIWPVEINEELYQQGIVSSNIEPVHLAILSLYKLVIIFYVLFQYIAFAKMSSGFIRKKMNYFTLAMILVIFGIGFVFLGGVFGEYEQIIKIIGGVILNLSMISVTKGLLMKGQEKE